MRQYRTLMDYCSAFMRVLNLIGMTNNIGQVAVWHRQSCEINLEK